MNLEEIQRLYQTAHFIRHLGMRLVDARLLAPRVSATPTP